MRSALYYPHSRVMRGSLWKTALLLWDKLHTIVPYEGYRPDYQDPLISEAYELMGVDHCPNDQEKRLVHEFVEDFATRPLPKAFGYQAAAADKDIYEVYPGKLLPKTWKVLEQAGLSGTLQGYGRHPTAEPTGLSLMSILADCCAGATLTRVTDREDAYASLSGLFVNDSWMTHENSTAIDQLVAISLEAVDLKNVSFTAILDMRRREVTTKKGGDITALRHRFADHLEVQAKRLLTATSERDSNQMLEEFRWELNKDFLDLREALQLRIVDVLATREVLTTAIASAGSYIALRHGVPQSLHQAFVGTGGLITLGGLAATASKMFTTRKKLFAEHPSAYLYGFRKGLKL